VSPLPVARASASASGIDDTPDPSARAVFLGKLAIPSLPLVAASASARPASGGEPGVSRVTLIALENTARGAAPDATPDEHVMIAELKEGERAAMELPELGAGCVTIVAQGGLGVVELDAFVTVGAGEGAHVVAEDARTGPIAILGGRGHCIEAAIKTAAASTSKGTLHLLARRGAGAVVARIYRASAAR
jgi:hypothetical protein